MLLAACAATPESETSGLSSITVGGESLRVVVADTSPERQQGLSGVEAIPDDADGMLFVWEVPTTTTFHMRGVQFPLDAWWFDDGGRLIGSAGMNTCAGSDCLSYASPGPVMWALETVAGEYTFAPGDALEFED